MLGARHPDTLNAMGNLASTLREGGGTKRRRRWSASGATSRRSVWLKLLSIKKGLRGCDSGRRRSPPARPCPPTARMAAATHRPHGRKCNFSRESRRISREDCRYWSLAAREHPRSRKPAVHVAGAPAPCPPTAGSATHRPHGPNVQTLTGKVKESARSDAGTSWSSPLTSIRAAETSGPRHSALQRPARLAGATHRPHGPKCKL